MCVTGSDHRMHRVIMKWQVLKLEEFGVTGADAHNVCYLRDVQDAAHLVDQMAACRKVEGKAVVIGGGYIGMECAAALHGNHIPVTMVFPEHHCSKWLHPSTSVT